MITIDNPSTKDMKDFRSTYNLVDNHTWNGYPVYYSEMHDRNIYFQTTNRWVVSNAKLFSYILDLLKIKVAKLLNQNTKSVSIFMHNIYSKMGTNGHYLGLVHHQSCTKRCPSDCSGEWEHVSPVDTRKRDIKVA